MSHPWHLYGIATGKKKECLQPPSQSGLPGRAGWGGQGDGGGVGFLFHEYHERMRKSSMSLQALKVK